MARLILSKEDLHEIEAQIEKDISKAVGGEVGVYIAVGDVDTVKPLKGDFMALEEYCNIAKMSFDRYNESSDILEVVPSIGRYERWRSHSLR